MVLTPNTEQVNTETNMELYRNNLPPRVSGGNLKFALREGKSSDSQPILTLYKLILLRSANYYINNEWSRLWKRIKPRGPGLPQISP